MPTDAHHPGEGRGYSLPYPTVPPWSPHRCQATGLPRGPGASPQGWCGLAGGRQRTQTFSCGNAHWLGLEPRGAVQSAGKAAAQALLRAALLGQPSNAARVLVQARVETTLGAAE